MPQYYTPVDPGQQFSPYTPPPQDPRPYTPVDPGQQFSPAPSGGSNGGSGGSSGGGSSARRRREEAARQEAARKAAEESARQEIARQEAAATAAKIAQENRTKAQSQTTAGQITKQDNQLTQEKFKADLSSQALTSGKTKQLKSSGNFITTEKKIELNQRQSTGFFGRVANFIGLGKEKPVKTSGYGRGTIVDTSVKDPFIVDRKENLKTQLAFDPSLSVPQSEFNRRLGKQISSDVETDLKPKYQARIDAGEDYEKVSKEYEQAYNKGFDQKLGSSEVQKRIRTKQGFDVGVKETFGRDYGQGVKRVASGALDVGVTALGPEIAVPFFVLKGSGKISKGSKKDIYQIDSKDSNLPLYPTRAKDGASVETKEGNLYLGFAGASALTGPGYVVRQAGRQQLKELSAQQFQITGKELIKSPEGSLLKIRAARTTASGSAKQEVEFLTPQFKINKGGVFGRTESGQEVLLKKGDDFTSFFVKKGSVRTKAVNPVDQRKVSDVTKLFSGQGRARQASAFRIGTNKKGQLAVSEEGFEGAYGGGFLDIGGKRQSFRFIGGSKKEADSIKVITGDPQKVKGFGSGVTTRGRITGSGRITPIQESSSTFSFGGTQSTGSRAGPILDLGATESVAAVNVIKQAGRGTANLFKSPFETVSTSTRAATRATPKISQVQQSRTQQFDIGLLKEPKQLDFSIPNTSSASAFADIIKTDTKQKPFVSSGSRQVNIQTLNTKQSIVPGLVEIQKPIPGQIPRQVPRGLTPFQGVPSGFDFPPESPGRFGIPKLPVPKVSIYDRGRRATKGKSFNFFGQYKPDVTSRAFDITSPSIPKGYFKGAGGLISRPVISNKKKKRSKK